MGFLNLFFPKFCAGCGKVGTYLCCNCIKEMRQGDLICPCCERLSVGGLAHPLCQKKYTLDGLWSLGVYQDPLRKVIQKLKYKFVTDLALVLVNLMVEYWAKFSPQFLEEIRKDQGVGWVIIPVPLHPKRQRSRGFNQSSKIGKLLAQKIGLNYQEVLKRIKYTKSQVGLKGRERRENVKNAFVLSTNYKSQPTNYLLIDDVWTTGSTLRECCWVLKRGGAKKVWAITLAR